MSNLFVVIAGPDLGKSFALPPSGALLIGRGRDAAARLNDLHVSRIHCRIEERDAHVVLTDMGSVAGTFVNEQRISECIVKVGSVIRLGTTMLRVEEADLADEPTLAPPPLPPTPLAAPPEPAVLPGSRASTVPRSRAPAAERLGELSGKALGHFTVREVLARGQSGLVFRATDNKDGRDIALKVLWPDFCRDRAGVQRFIRSMRTMLPIRHPHLIPLYGAGKTGPYCWVSMELIEGESLTQVIQRIGVAGMLDWRHAMRVALHVSRALAFAHGNHIVHRNITPQNTLVRASDKAVLLGDLLLAKALEGSLAQAITRPGEIVGDVRYMSPERLRDSRFVDARSDLYSLGAMVYALLTGRPPLEGGTLQDTIIKIQSEEPVRPKKYQLALSDQFEGVVMKMLAKRPEDRFQDAGDLLTQLNRVAKFQGLEF
jgi:serine/threonine protein kinase